MTELAMILTLALLNVALILCREPEVYVESRLSQFSFAAGIPVALITVTALFLIGGPLIASYVTGLIAALNILHLLSLMADGPGGG